MRAETIRIGQNKMDAILPITLTHLWGEWEGVEASVRLRWEEGKLFIRFMVKEKQLRRMTREHNEAVWEDSCVEAFLMREGEKEYVNVECSASTRMLVARGESRHGRQYYPVEFIDTIPLTITVMEHTNAGSRWRADLELDLVALGLMESGERMEDVKLLGNFYKCGDKLDEPHFLAAGEIMTAAPDFHRSEYFIPLSFTRP